jgi:hypothetical protein
MDLQETRAGNAAMAPTESAIFWQTRIPSKRCRPEVTNILPAQCFSSVRTAATIPVRSRQNHLDLQNRNDAQQNTFHRRLAKIATDCTDGSNSFLLSVK